MEIPMEWQPIETAPKDGTLILGVKFDTDGQPWLAAFEWIIAGIWDAYQWEVDWEPTHWMPLPAPPQ
jgi:hypothetical protein